MDYFASIHVGKVLEKVIIHMEVFRERPYGEKPISIWRYTELLEEQAHPEPVKWLREHVIQAFEEMP